jgi:hypothetical protein
VAYHFDTVLKNVSNAYVRMILNRVEKGAFVKLFGIRIRPERIRKFSTGMAGTAENKNIVQLCNKRCIVALCYLVTHYSLCESIHLSKLQRIQGYLIHKNNGVIKRELRM